MKRSRLRARTGMRYVLLNPILEELAREGGIKMTGWEARGSDSSNIAISALPIASLSFRNRS